MPTNDPNNASTYLAPAEADIAAAIDAGVAIGEPHLVADEQLALVTVPRGGKVHEIDLRALDDRYAAHPRRKTGTVHVQSAPSFVTYVEKHGLASTEIWADPARKALVGVINAHAASRTPKVLQDDDDLPAPAQVIYVEESEGTAGHGDHRVSLELIRTKSWKSWLEHDKKWLNQQEFAEHLEDNLLDIIEPDSATILEIAQSFQATVGVDFKSGQRLSSGETELRYEETTTARAGQKGDLEIPNIFTLAVRPYEGSDAEQSIDARFRYRIRDGRLSLSYALSYPDRLEESVFDQILNDVDGALTQPVFLGRPG